MADPVSSARSPKPTLEQGQTIRTMRDDLERIKRGEFPLPSTPPPPVAPVGLGSEDTSLSFVEPPEPPPPAAEPLAPLQPGDFDLFAHLSGERPSSSTTMPLSPPSPPSFPKPPREPLLQEEKPAPASEPPLNLPSFSVKEPPAPPSLSPLSYSSVPRTQPRPPFAQSSTQPTPSPSSPHITEDFSQFPESPLRPEELLALEEETLGTASGESRFRLPALHIPRLALFGALGLLLAGAVGGGAYFFFLRGPAPEETPPPPAQETPQPQPPEAEAPIPLLPLPPTTLTFTAQEEARVELQELFARSDPNGTLRAINLLVSNAEENRYLGFNEIAMALEITFPDSVRNAINGDRFTFFVANEPGTGETRAGLAFAVTNTQALTEALASWEATMPQDLDALLMSLGKTESPAELRFKVTVRNGITNHYLNFSEPTTSLDYSIDPARNIFLLATSRNTMYAALDVLTGTAQ